MSRNIWLMNLAAAFMWMSMYAYVPTLPAYAATIGANALTIGIIGGAYGVFQVLLRIPLGFISDKIGKDKLLLIIGFSIMILSAVVFVFLHSVVWVIVGRALAGAAAAWWVIVSASYAKYNDEDKQVKAQGVISASANIGKVVAALLCAFIAQFFGYEATFVVALITGVIGLCLMFRLKEPKKEVLGKRSLKEQLLLVKNKELIFFSILAILSQLLCFAIPTTFTQVVAEEVGANSLQLGMLMVVFFLSVSVSSLFVGTKAYKKIGGINTMAISFALGAVSCIPLFYTNMVSIYLMQVISGICYGITQAALAGCVIRCVPAVQRGMATGIYQSLFGAGILLGPVLAGVLIELSSVETAYWTFFAFMILSAGLCYVLIPKKYNRLT